MRLSTTLGKKEFLTNWFAADTIAATLPLPTKHEALEEASFWGNVGKDITSPVVCVEGVEGAELRDGPVVFALTELVAWPEYDIGCFLFCPLWLFGALNEQMQLDQFLPTNSGYKNNGWNEVSSERKK